MRGFFLLLLLTNLFFLAWQLYADREEQDISPYRGVTRVNQGLQLLSELAATEQPAVRAQAEQDAHVADTTKLELISPKPPETKPPRVDLVAESGSICYQSVMFESLAEATALQKVLEKLGITTSQRSAVETTSINYWVKLPPYKSRSKANEAAEILKQNRIKDFFIVRSGRHENAISLGVFSTKERADIRYKAITDLKVRLRRPVIEEMDVPAKRLVVAFSIKADEVPEGLTTLLDAKSGVKLKKISCKP